MLQSNTGQVAKLNLIACLFKIICGILADFTLAKQYVKRLDRKFGRQDHLISIE